MSEIFRPTIEYGETTLTEDGVSQTLTYRYHGVYANGAWVSPDGVRIRLEVGLRRGDDTRFVLLDPQQARHLADRLVAMADAVAGERPCA